MSVAKKPRLTPQEKRLNQRLDELQAAADRLLRIDRLDAGLLYALVTYGILRAKGIPTDKDSVREFKEAINLVSHAPGGWWNDVADDTPEEQSSGVLTKKQERLRADGAAIIRSILECSEGEP